MRHQGELALHHLDFDRRLPQGGEKIAGGSRHAIVFLTQRRQNAFDETRQLASQIGRQHRQDERLAGAAPGRIGQGGNVVEQGVLHTIPATPADRRIKLGQCLLLRVVAGLEFERDLPQLLIGKLRDIGQIGDLVVAGLIVGRRRRQVANRQTLERFPGHMGGIFRIDHRTRRGNFRLAGRRIGAPVCKF